jgi:hypothetical protein
VEVDPATLEANAAMQSIVHHDTGDGYETYVKQTGEAVLRRQLR